MASSQPKMEHPGISDPSSKVWVILGSKRGGTSFLAQVLGENGIEIAHCGNGHNEDLDFVQFNEAVLREAGGDWNRLPAREKVAAAVETHGERLEALIAAKSNGKAWGWKDPRQGATIEHFLPYLDGDVYLVCVFRRPDRVAESIHRIWPQHSVERGKEIALDYYERIQDAIKEFIHA